MRNWIVVPMLILSAAALVSPPRALAAMADADAPLQLSCSFEERQREKPLSCDLSARVCSVSGANCADKLRLTCTDGTQVSARYDVETTLEDGDLTLESPKSEPPISVLVRFLGEIQGSGVPAVMRIGEDIHNELLTGECEVRPSE